MKKLNLFPSSRVFRESLRDLAKAASQHEDEWESAKYQTKANFYRLGWGGDDTELLNQYIECLEEERRKPPRQQSKASMT